MSNPETRPRTRFPPGEGAQGPGFWVSRRPQGRGQNDDLGGLPGSGGATLGDLNREAREGWLSACFSLPQCLLPQLSTHSRVSAGMCSLSLRDFMLRPGPRVCGRVPTLPSWLPGPVFCSIRPTDRRRHGDSKLGGSSGRAAWGLGRRGGRALSASGRGSEPRTCAQAQRGRSGQSAGGWSRRCHPLPERDAGAARSQAHGLRGGKDRTVAVSSARIITPSPGSSPSLPRPSPTPRVSRTRIRARPGPCLPTSALAIPGGGLQPPRSNRRPWPRLHV